LTSGGADVRCVYFDIPPEECIRRIQSRTEHPSLPPERAEAAVLEFATTFRIPERLSEGPYTYLYISQQRDVDELVRSLSVA